LISRLIDKALEETIMHFSSLFYNGNIERAKEKLKILPNQWRRSHSKTFRTGFFSGIYYILKIYKGCNIILTIIAIYIYLDGFNRKDRPKNYQETFFLFRLILFPILLMLSIGTFYFLLKRIINKNMVKIWNKFYIYIKIKSKKKLFKLGIF
jgi:hypothetical protein